MTYQEILDKTLNHIQVFHEGEICHVYDINTAERCAFYVASGLVKYYIWYREDGSIREWEEWDPV